MSAHDIPLLADESSVNPTVRIVLLDDLNIGLPTRQTRGHKQAQQRGKGKRYKEPAQTAVALVVGYGRSQEAQSQVYGRNE
jgi:hypothetical protein